MESTTLILSTLILLIISKSIQLITCPTGCICNDTELFVHCKNFKLDSIPMTFNPQVTKLLLNNNYIKSIDKLLFQFYEDLQKLDISSNMINSLPKDTFVAQKNLNELDLNRNKISIIEKSAFFGLKQLSVLSLQNNIVDVITEFMFADLTNLVQLNFGQNRIAEIHPKAFSKLNNLRILYLDDNLLSSISSLPMNNLTNLAELYIGKNNFKTLNNDCFVGLSHLLRLDLSGSVIFNISEYAFRNLSSLRFLNLVDNRLQDVPTSQLSYLNRLEELYMGQNSFRVITADAFRGLDSLKKLDITGAMHLEMIESGAFNTNLNLEVLILKDNRALKIVGSGILVGFPKLKHVTLHNNAFETFNEDILSWNDVKHIDLSNNPLLCDCQLLWLSRYLANRNVSEVQCSLPFSLKDRPLKMLNAVDLGCSFSDPHQQILFGAMCLIALILLSGVGMCNIQFLKAISLNKKNYIKSS